MTSAHIVLRTATADDDLFVVEMARHACVIEDRPLPDPDEDHDALCTNVHVRNPAKRLYERKGFRGVGQGNGPLGLALIKDLRPHATTGSGVPPA